MANCTACGFDIGAGKYCPKCGTYVSVPPPPPSSPHPGGWQQPPQPQFGAVPPYGQHQYAAPKDKMTAALLAIFIGGLGIHKFYLGGKKQKTAAIFQIVISIVTCGAGSVIPLIEGIIYLTKDDQQFQYEYVQGDKDWF